MTDEELQAVKAPADAATQRPIPGYDGYLADKDGHIWSFSSNWRGYGVRILAEDVDLHGYLKVRVYRNGRRIRKAVHRLVALAFHGLPGLGEEVRHLDGSRTNNRPSNLEWGTRKENAADRDRHGRTARGEHNGTRLHPERVARGDRSAARLHPERLARGETAGSAKLTSLQVVAIRQLAQSGATFTSLGLRFGVNRTTIRRVITREGWAHVE